MPSSLKDLLVSAHATVPTISPQDAAALMGNADVFVVDVRDGPELLSTGKICGAIHVTRGMIEFRADLDSPYHDKTFSLDKTVLVYCASGGRSAFAGKALQGPRYKDVRNLCGFKEWAGSGGMIEKV